MLGASRQSINKELRVLMAEGCVELRYGKIHLKNLQALCEQYERMLGAEQIAAAYENIT